MLKQFMLTLNQILDSWEDEPPVVRFRELRKNKYEKEKETMGRPHTNIKRQKPMGSHGVEKQGKGPLLGVPEKQFKQTGPKYTGPNYPKMLTTAGTSLK